MSAKRSPASVSSNPLHAGTESPPGGSKAGAGTWHLLGVSAIGLIVTATAMWTSSPKILRTEKAFTAGSKFGEAST
eukprot:2802931-Alexandrium_andersonii.AAC.1